MIAQGLERVRREGIDGVRADRDFVVGALLTTDVLDTDFDLPADFDFTAEPALAGDFFDEAFPDPLAAFRLNRR